MTEPDDKGVAASGPDVTAWLAGYPDAALLISPDLQVLATNVHGEELAPLLMAERMPDLRSAVAEAVEGGKIAADTFDLAVEGGNVVLDVTIVPRARGADHLALVRDVTIERNLKPALIESRQRYKDLVEVSSDFAWEVGPEGTFVFVSSHNVLGYSADELIGHSPEDFVVDAATYRPLPFCSDQPVEGVDLWMRRPDGTLACVSVSCRPLRDDDGAWLGSRGVCRDVTRERERETALIRARHREQILHYVMRAIRNEVEPENMLAAASAAAARALGAAGCRIFRKRIPEGFALAAEYGDTSEVEDLGAMLAAIGDADTTFEKEIGPWRMLGAVTDYRTTINGGICVWKAAGFVEWSEDERFLVSDIADQLGIAIEQINNHERIVSLSKTDALTGLLNRRAFYEDEMPRRLRRLARSNTSAALYYVDLDNFKAVNDLHGHHRGDEALMALRDLLLEYSRPGDVIARIGGDEFVMWLDGILPDVAEVRARQLIEASRRLRVFSEGAEKQLGLSVGVAVYDPLTRESLDELLARADVAMYAVKHRGKGGYEMAPPAGK